MSGGMTLVAVPLGPVGSGVEPACLCTSCICLITWGSSKFEGHVSTLDSWSCLVTMVGHIVQLIYASATGSTIIMWSVRSLFAQNTTHVNATTQHSPNCNEMIRAMSWH